MNETPTYEELEASVDLFHRCYQAAREIWRKDHPDRARHFDPSGEKAIAAMIAEHSHWEKTSLTELCKINEGLNERIAELGAEVEGLQNDNDDLEDSVVELESRLEEVRDDEPAP